MKGLATGASNSKSSFAVQKSGHMYILTGINSNMIIGKPMAARLAGGIMFRYRLFELLQKLRQSRLVRARQSSIQFLSDKILGGRCLEWSIYR